MPPRFCGPAIQSPTVVTYTLTMDCPYCLPWTAPLWFCCAYCWCLWALLTQFLPNFVSSMTITHERNNTVCWSIYEQKLSHDEWSAGNYPPHAVNCKGTSAAHAVPPNVYVTNSEGWHQASAPDTGILSNTFCDRLLPISCKSYCRFAVANSLSMLRFVPVNDTLQNSLIGWLLLVRNIS